MTMTKGLPFVHFYHFHVNDEPADLKHIMQPPETYLLNMYVYKTNIVLYLLFEPNNKILVPKGCKLL